MSGRIAAAIGLIVIVCACETSPPLPPPGPVATADQAIRIALNKCNPRTEFDYGAHDVAAWNAQRQSDRWLVTFHGTHRSGATLVLSVEIRPEDGEVLNCLDRETVNIPT